MECLIGCVVLDSSFEDVIISYFLFVIFVTSNWFNCFPFFESKQIV